MNDSKSPGLALKDPVCGMQVGPDSSFRSRFNDREHVFCSRRCQDEFLACPKKYLSLTYLVDLICGRTVRSDSHFKTVYQGQEYAFCSQQCESDFRETPEKFTAGLPSYFLCPTHPDVRQTEPGRCPECGTAMEAVKTKWICPYHPELLHDEPGACPIYGMPLIPEPPGRFFSCACHPEVKLLEPGKCPRCRMKLQPYWNQVAQVRTTWVCPRHPDICNPEPGKCEVCGLKLERQEISAGKGEGSGSPSTPGGAGVAGGGLGFVCPKCGLKV